MNKNDDVGPSRGSIICTASNAGIYPFPVGPLYAASKAGVIGFVRSMAPVIAKNKIQINALAPAVLGEYPDSLRVVYGLCHSMSILSSTAPPKY